MKFNKYHKIPQFRDVVRAVTHKAHFVGLDEDNQPIYDTTRDKPILTFTGTVKLHGTNAMLVYTPESGVVGGKRSSLLPMKNPSEHFGFTQFIMENKDYLEKKMNELWNKYCVEGEQLTVFGEWAGCFSYDTPILLSDGTTRNIGQIVKNKENVEVLSFNTNTGKLEPKKVVNWFNNGTTDDWLKIGYKRRKRGGRKPYIKVTPNHKIFTKRNKKIVEVSAGELAVGDTVFTSGTLINQNQLDFIRGSLMGDASISDIKHFQVSHSEDKQSYYNKFIKKLLGNISSDTKKISGFGSNMRGVYTKSLNEVEDIYYETYIQGKKRPNLKFLNKLNSKSLAVWYMDDGTLSNHSGKNRQKQAELMTLGWGWTTNQLISDWLESRGYENYICKDNSYEETKYFIRFTPKGTIRFLSDIKYFMLSEFDYKLPDYMRGGLKYDWMQTYGEYEKGLVETKIESIEKYKPKENFKKVKYDIEVEDNHNYFANRLLVHNSGIQKGVGISELPKSFYIFDAKIRKIETNSDVWVYVATSDFEFDLDNVHNIYDFPIYNVIVDFNEPKKSQNAFIEITEQVEKECPVAKQLGVEGNLVGEGVVWTTFWEGEKFIFKVKGDKHSNTKVKKLAKVDTEKLENIEKFVEYACTENRIEQGIQESNATERKDVGELIRWVANDIIDEEMDTLKDNNLEWREVAKHVATKTRKYYFDKLNEIL